MNNINMPSDLMSIIGTMRLEVTEKCRKRIEDAKKSDYKSERKSDYGITSILKNKHNL